MLKIMKNFVNNFKLIENLTFPRKVLIDQLLN